MRALHVSPRVRENLQAVTAMIAVAALIVTVYLFAQTSRRLSADEHTTCKIQGEELPISHLQVRAWSDIRQLVNTPKPPPKNVPPHVLAVAADLRFILDRYGKLEHHLPRKRTC